MQKVVTPLNKSEILEFTRYMDYTLGRAFSIVSGTAPVIKDTKLEINDECKEMIADALICRPAYLHAALYEQLKRKLISMRKRLGEDEVFFILYAILDASKGDYELLMTTAERYEVFDAEAAEYFFGGANV